MYGEYIKKVAALGGGKAMIITFGCQQNEADSDKVRGMLASMGYIPTECREEADIIVLNTCAVREHAELRVFGILGALKALKRKNPSLVIAVCGCMVQQAHIADDISRKYDQVDIIFGTHSREKFPKMLYEVLSGRRVEKDLSENENDLGENIPVVRKNKFSALVTIMYGCNNFCTYCIVPYVRGRERSRKSDNIISEITALVADGCKEIMLLGQNVNSYGKDIEGECNFATLLRKVNAIDGDFLIRFMSSHPKDITNEVIDAMAECEKVERHLHLPVQCGSDRLLKIMNRRYTCDAYEKIIAYAREKMPDLSVTSDIIVGFPGETDEDFEDTLALMQRVRFDSAYTFIYSRRKGTPAYSMDNQVPQAVKGERMDTLMQVQNEISKEKNKALEGTVQRVLVEGVSKNDDTVMCAHTSGAKTVNFKCDKSLIGQFVNVKITEAKTFSLTGKII